MRKGKQPRERILARSTQLFNRRREAIGRMSFATRKKLMMSQETPAIDHPMPSERSNAISSISAIAYGFMGSQALFAALELGLFTTLSAEPCGLHDLAKRLDAPAGLLSVLLSTCLALGLLTWDGQHYSNSPAAQHFLVRSARSYVGDYYLRQISAVLYGRMPLVRALLRGEPAAAPAYVTTLDSPHVTEEFIRGQHGGSLAPASWLARTLDLSGTLACSTWAGDPGHLPSRRSNAIPGCRQ